MPIQDEAPFPVNPLAMLASDYPECWGSVHLVAPNPVFRDLEVRRQPTSTADRESILLRFQPRAGKDLQGLIRASELALARSYGSLRNAVG
jgi:hypothetical protein